MSQEDAAAGTINRVERRATTPIAGAVAGLMFAVLFGLSLIIMFTTMTHLSRDTGAWLESGSGRLRFAVGLMPFAGIFFLWFIGVARERLGRFEDQFFSTVFLGSGLLFLAMVFAATASVGAIVTSYARDPAVFLASGTYFYARQVVSEIFNVYALRMAAVFMLSQATLWVRTAVMPRWLAFVTYAVALVLMFVVSQSLWVTLVFPAWVALVSGYILVAHIGATK